MTTGHGRIRRAAGMHQARIGHRGAQSTCRRLPDQVLELRKKTERPEAIAAGFAELVGTEEDFIVERDLNHFDKKGRAPSLCNQSNPFVDGEAALRIADIIARTS